jgi:hypothetical protein
MDNIELTDDIFLPTMGNRELTAFSSPNSEWIRSTVYLEEEILNRYMKPPRITYYIYNWPTPCTIF